MMIEGGFVVLRLCYSFLVVVGMGLRGYWGLTFVVGCD